MKIEVLSCILHLKPFPVFPLPWMHTNLLLGHCSLYNPDHFNLSDLFSCRCHPWFQSHLVTCNFEVKPHGVSHLYLSTSLFLCLANPWPHLFPQPAPRHTPVLISEVCTAKNLSVTHSCSQSPMDFLMLLLLLLHWKYLFLC